MSKLIIDASHRSRAAFLDRDGTLVKAFGGRPANTVDEIALLPGVPEGLRELNATGLLLVVVSNQGGIGLGYMTNEMMKAMNERLNDLLIMAKAPTIDAFYWCPHRKDEGCACRKPSPGMFYQAKEDLGIDLEHSYMIGNDPRDIDAAVRAGIKWPFMVMSDHYQDTPFAKLVSPTFKEAAHVASLMEEIQRCAS